MVFTKFSLHCSSAYTYYTFNRFVKPGEGAIWNDNITSIHGLHPNHPSIIGADDMDTVWGQFVWWYEDNMESGEVAIIVAYNGGRVLILCEQEELKGDAGAL